MATFNIRIDDALKDKSFAALEKIGVSPSDAVRQLLQYVAENGKLPIKTVVVSDEDADLLEEVQKRLNEPHLFKKVTLDELFSRSTPKV